MWSTHRQNSELLCIRFQICIIIVQLFFNIFFDYHLQNFQQIECLAEYYVNSNFSEMTKQFIFNLTSNNAIDETEKIYYVLFVCENLQKCQIHIVFLRCQTIHKTKNISADYMYNYHIFNRHCYLLCLCTRRTRKSNNWKSFKNQSIFLCE